MCETALFFLFITLKSFSLLAWSTWNTWPTFFCVDFILFIFLLSLPCSRSISFLLFQLHVWFSIFILFTKWQYLMTMWKHRVPSVCSTRSGVNYEIYKCELSWKKRIQVRLSGWESSDGEMREGTNSCVENEILFHSEWSHCRCSPLNFF